MKSKIERLLLQWNTSVDACILAIVTMTSVYCILDTRYHSRWSGKTYETPDSEHVVTLRPSRRWCKTAPRLTSVAVQTTKAIADGNIEARTRDVDV
jgi:hypothetical protein